MPVTIARLTPVAFALLGSARAACAAAAQSAPAAAGSRRGVARTGAQAGAAARSADDHPACAAVRDRPVDARRRSRRRRSGAPRARATKARYSCAPTASRARRTNPIEASGKVELRTRRETVLADWLRYDFLDRRNLGQRRRPDPVRLRLDHRAGSQVQARHGNGLLRVAAVLRRARTTRAAARRRSGSRAPITTKPPTRATRRASRRARIGTSAWASSRSTRRGWWAPATTRRCISSARPSSIRRGSSFRCRTSASPGSSRRRRA